MENIYLQIKFKDHLCFYKTFCFSGGLLLLDHQSNSANSYSKTKGLFSNDSEVKKLIKHAGDY